MTAPVPADPFGNALKRLDAEFLRLVAKFGGGEANG